MDIVINSHLGTILRKHQVEGSKFLFDKLMSNDEMERYCMLCDVPGAGKCLTILCVWWAICSLEDDLKKTFLILAPKSVVSHWAAEYGEWKKKAGVSFGSHDHLYLMDGIRNSIDEKLKLLTKWRTGGGILIMSYALWRSLINTELLNHKKPFLMREFLQSPGPYLVGLDEAHTVRKLEGKLHMEVAKIPSHGLILITATIMQNTLLDVYALLRLLRIPGIGLKKDFTNYFVKPIEAGLRLNSTRSNLKKMESRVQELRTIVNSSSFFSSGNGCLQSIKEDWIVFLAANPAQVTIYNQLLREHDQGASQIRGSEVIGMLSKCNVQVDNPVLAEIGELENSCQGVKLDLMTYILQAASVKQDKVLIYSSRLYSLKVIYDFVVELGWTCLRIDGSTSLPDREITVSNFASLEGKVALVLSCGAASEGINLSAANVVIIYNTEWNPYVEFQALSRVNRAGQEKKITIIRIVLDGSHEIFIRNNQRQKMILGQLLVENPTVNSSFEKKNFMDFLRNSFLLPIISNQKKVTRTAPEVDMEDAEYITILVNSADHLLSRNPVRYSEFVGYGADTSMQETNPTSAIRNELIKLEFDPYRLPKFSWDIKFDNYTT